MDIILRMNDRKAFTVEANEELSKRFSEQVEERGYTKYRAIEGAIRMWLTLTPHEQVELIKGKTKPGADTPSKDEVYTEIEKLALQWKLTNEKIQAFQAANRQIKTRRRRKNA